LSRAASVIDANTSVGRHTAVSISTVVRPAFIEVMDRRTPGRSSRVSSMSMPQLAQCMPSTRNVNVAIEALLS